MRKTLLNREKQHKFIEGQQAGAYGLLAACWLAERVMC